MSPVDSVTPEASLAERVARWLRAARGTDLAVAAVSPLTGGACQENFKVTVQPGDGAPEETWALRSDARTALPGSLGRAAEAAVMAAAAAAGVRTPAPRWPTAELVRPGAHAYFTAWLPGEAVGARVVRAPALAAARAGLTAAVAAEAARIHRITPQSHPDLPIDRVPFRAAVDPAEAAIGFLRGLLRGLARPDPALAWGVDWLARHRPPPGPVTLVHGDLRTGNLMVSPAGLEGVLDWEFAHWGDPAEDLAWLCVRDWRFGAVGLPVGGFGHRPALLAAYRAAGGAELEPARLRWWEVAGNLRWGAATALQGQRYFAGDRDLELLAIPPRAAEMAWEALRLTGALAAHGGASPVADARAASTGPLDPLDPAVQAQAVAELLTARVLPALAEDRGLAYRVRVATHLLGGLARGLARPDTGAHRQPAAWRAALGEGAPSQAEGVEGEGEALAARRLLAGDLEPAPRAALVPLIEARLRATLGVWAPDFAAGRDLDPADEWTAADPTAADPTAADPTAADPTAAEDAPHA